MRPASTSTRTMASDGPYQVIKRPEMSTTRSSGKVLRPVVDGEDVGLVGQQHVSGSAARMYMTATWG